MSTHIFAFNRTEVSIVLASLTRAHAIGKAAVGADDPDVKEIRDLIARMCKELGITPTEAALA